MKMKTFCLAAVAACLPLASPALAKNVEKPTIDDFATRLVMLNPAVSPDGDKIAYRIAQTKKGDYAIEVRDLDRLERKPVRLGATEMRITGFRWLNDEYLLVNFEQRVRDQVKEINEGVFEDKAAIVRADGKGRWIETYDDLEYVGFLPDDPEHVLVRTSKYRADDGERATRNTSIGDLVNTDFYKFKVSTGVATKTVLRANPSMFDYRFDKEGFPRLATTYDEGSRNFSYLYRAQGENTDWETLYVRNADDYGDQFDIIAFDPLDDSKLFVSATNGENFASIWLFDIASKSFDEKILSVPGQDIEVGEFDPNYKSEGLIAFEYFDEKGLSDRIFLDGELGALYDSLKQAFPDSEIYFGRQSIDETAMTVRVEKWDDPSTYYLIKDGELSMFGHSSGTMNDKQLSKQEYITYKSRDGKDIPGYITIPDGEGPFPLIVMPHGGPWVAYRPSPYDEWSQMLASHGYMVLDPLFRGTEGLGTEFWTSSFGRWGETMSDDMDDGVAHLVAEGLVDPERVAMFGWSFGGYSSFAASMRAPQIYQCVIPGAGVSDPLMFRSEFVANRFQRPLLETGYDGLNVVKHTDKVSVPMLIIHGELDQRVEIKHSENFIKGLNKNGKSYKFLELEGADHFDSTLTYDHRVEMYNAMIDFLRNDCGPGGL